MESCQRGAAAVDSLRRDMCFLNIRACKPFQAITQIETMNQISSCFHIAAPPNQRVLLRSAATVKISQKSLVINSRTANVHSRLHENNLECWHAAYGGDKQPSQRLIRWLPHNKTLLPAQSSLIKRKSKRWSRNKGKERERERKRERDRERESSYLMSGGGSGSSHNRSGIEGENRGGQTGLLPRGRCEISWATLGMEVSCWEL